MDVVHFWRVGVGSELGGYYFTKEAPSHVLLQRVQTSDSNITKRMFCGDLFCNNCKHDYKRKTFQGIISKSHRGIKMDGFKMARFFCLLELLVPVCFGNLWVLL